MKRSRPLLIIYMHRHTCIFELVHNQRTHVTKSCILRVCWKSSFLIWKLQLNYFSILHKYWANVSLIWKIETIMVVSTCESEARGLRWVWGRDTGQPGLHKKSLCWKSRMKRALSSVSLGSCDTHCHTRPPSVSLGSSHGTCCHTWPHLCLWDRHLALTITPDPKASD